MDALYANQNAIHVVLVTLVLGGGAACLSGRAIARAWRPPWQVAVAALLLGAAVRFIYYALLGGTLLSPASYIVDTSILLVAGMIAWRATWAAQMVRQYPWLYVRASPLGWREIRPQNAPQQ
ncbi:MAG: hypothetical protein KGQ47_10610 [Hyphomicrobiales bacterium]|nr:hypothetical protein [Hyphomicrobiales bacterium]